MDGHGLSRAGSVRLHPEDGDGDSPASMKDVADEILDGHTLTRDRTPSTVRSRPGCQGWLYCRPRADADADRRELADLPRVLRPADRHGHEPPDRSPTPCSASRRCCSTWCGTTQPDQVIVTFDLPRRRSATRWSTRTRPAARRRPTSCASRWAWSARSSTRSQLPVVDPGRASRPTTSSPRSPCTPWPRVDDVIIVTGDRDSYQLVARSAHQGALQQAGRVRLRLLRRGGHLRSHRRPAASSTSSTPRCGATRPTTCRASPGWARRPPPSWSTATAGSTASSPTSTSRPPSSARTSSRTRRRPCRTAR